MLLLDTQVLIWIRFGDRRLGRNARDVIERAVRGYAVSVSAISAAVEVADLPASRAS